MGTKPQACREFNIEIVERISKGTLAGVRKAIKHIEKETGRKCSSRHEGLNVTLVSDGGDVDAALAIGRLLRENKAHVIIPRAHQCNSSCVFLIAGAVERLISGKVGIHRPYFAELSIDVPVATIRKAREERVKKIRSFLDEMDIAPQLLDAMLSVPPSEVRYLTESELKLYRLSITDPTQDEANAAMFAEVLGISTAEWRRRQARADQECAYLFNSEAMAQYLECQREIEFAPPSK